MLGEVVPVKTGCHVNLGHVMLC